MLKCIVSFALLLTIVDGTTSISLINNAAYLPSNMTNMFTYTSSCDECICYGFFSNISIDYQLFNCYKNNKTCLLFENLLSKSLIHINLNSTLYFKQSQLLETTSQILSTEPTTTYQCYQLQWNSTGITFASRGSNLNQVYDAYGLFIAAGSDTLYIADTGNTRILKWVSGDTSGTLVAGGQGAGSNATQLCFAVVVCVDINENVYVADSGNYRIQYFDRGSSIGRTIAGNGTSNTANNTIFGQIFGLGVDRANNVYVSDYDRNRVTKWSPNATYGVLVAGNGSVGDLPNQLHTPTAFYVDPITGTLYIPNQDGHCIAKWLPGSSVGIIVAGVCGVPGTNQTLLTQPTCVTFDKYGNMYVTDRANAAGRILMFCPNSSIGIEIVTSGISNPISIAVDTHLNIYVTDYGNQRIVKYSLLNDTTTVTTS